MSTHKLNIEGMTCNGCANRLTKALKEVHGVTNAIVSVADGTATIDCEADTDPRSLTAVVEAKGYRARVAQ